MTAIKTRKYSVHTLEHEGEEFDLSFGPNDKDELIIKRTPNDYTIVGYLVHDDNAEDPIESCDGMGKIYDRRHARSSDQYEIERAMKNPLHIMLNVYSHGMEAWEVAGSNTASWPDRQWDVSNYAGVWVPDDSCLQHIQSIAISKFLPEGTKVEYKSVYNPDSTVQMLADGKTPNPKFFNSITYTLPDGRTQSGYKSFHSAYVAAARVLGIKIDRKLVPEKQREVAVECAKQAICEYNKWLSGDCWGVCVDCFNPQNDRIEEDSCWGYIGSEYAMEEANRQVDYHVEKYSKENPDERDNDGAEHPADAAQNL